MSYYGHTFRHNNIAKTILQGKDESSRIRGRPKKDWMSNIIMWTKKKKDELTMLTKDIEVRSTIVTMQARLFKI